eukprot:sb/3469184/
MFSGYLLVACTLPLLIASQYTINGELSSFEFSKYALELTITDTDTQFASNNQTYTISFDQALEVTDDHYGVSLEITWSQQPYNDTHFRELEIKDLVRYASENQAAYRTCTILERGGGIISVESENVDVTPAGSWLIMNSGRSQFLEVLYNDALFLSVNLSQINTDCWEELLGFLEPVSVDLSHLTGTYSMGSTVHKRKLIPMGIISTLIYSVSTEFTTLSSTKDHHLPTVSRTQTST